MRILALKPGHDGHIVHLVDDTLVWVMEAEKDSGVRYSALDAAHFAQTLQLVDRCPDVIALSGWAGGASPCGRPIGAGYFGVDAVQLVEGSLFGTPLRYFSSSHERSHVVCAYALSPFPQGTPCYALTWEGYIGAFYEVVDNVKIKKLSDIMLGPGIRYAASYAIADPTFYLPRGAIRLGDAGKLMALAAFETCNDPTSQERKLLSRLLSSPLKVPDFYKNNFRGYDLYNSGVESKLSKRMARLITDSIFKFFAEKITPLVKDKRPLLISGGCGLNCEWNRRWLDSGIFEDVFVPPCTNDVGAAVGTAADALLHYTGNCKLRWNVPSGLPFIDDVDIAHHRYLGSFKKLSNDPRITARLLRMGAILGWVCGKSEIGPRALGHRSILASPFDRGIRERLNKIKQREQFRPIAPLCIEEDAHRYFDIERPDPYMLFFARAKIDRLQAVTHVDGSARVQTINATQNNLLYQVLLEFKAQTEVGVLCNTSLNFNGCGFINRSSDLIRYASEHGLDGFVIEGTIFLRDTCRFADEL